MAKPKEEGGLRLQSAKGRNTSLLAKLNWQFHTEKDATGVQVLRNKYCNFRRVNAINADRSTSLLIDLESYKKGNGFFY